MKIIERNFNFSNFIDNDQKNIDRTPRLWTIEEKIIVEQIEGNRAISKNVYAVFSLNSFFNFKLIINIEIDHKIKFWST